MGNRWKSEISRTILNIFRPHKAIDVLKLPFLEELYEKSFVVTYALFYVIHLKNKSFSRVSHSGERNCVPFDYCFQKIYRFNFHVRISKFIWMRQKLNN